VHQHESTVHCTDLDLDAVSAAVWRMQMLFYDTQRVGHELAMFVAPELFMF
jgi:hypothetical protein